MCPLTRRRLLHGTTALFATLAGCGGESTTTSSSSESRFENVEKNPDQFALRVPGGDEAVWRWESNSDSDSKRPLSRRLVATEKTAQSIVFADVDGKSEAEQFVADTDFDAETLYVEQDRIRECYERELCYVSWSATEMDTNYARILRDANVECSEDVRDTVAQLIRIPAALDPEEVTSHGSGVGNGGCRYPPAIRTTDETQTETSTAETKTNSTTETEAEN